jgi:hypothetical protein
VILFAIDAGVRDIKVTFPAFRTVGWRSLSRSLWCWVRGVALAFVEEFI